MIKAELTLPEIGLSAEQRKAVGWTLVGVGALTTIPLAFAVLGKRE